MNKLRQKNKKVFISGDEAIAIGVKLCKPGVIAAYPITPQTVIVEKLSEYKTSNEIEAEYLHVESEHSAMAAVMGASMMGVRTFTATSSQGLLYMSEMLHYVSGSRFPVVMVNANRTLAAPWNIYGDHRDSISQRDTGWIQLYVENCQEALDTLIQSYRIAEHKNILTPVMINIDGFVITHTYELVEIPTEEQVNAFLPSFETENKFDFNKPKSLCFTAGPEWQTEFRYQQQEAMEASKKVIYDVDELFGKMFGRTYGGLVEEYEVEGADYVIVALGSVVGTVKIIVDMLRREGKRVGLVKLRSFRPFPKEYFKSLSKKVKCVGIIDRDISFGYEGAVYSEVKAALYIPGTNVRTMNFIAGISGRDIRKEFIIKMYEKLESLDKDEAQDEVQFIGLRW